MASKLQFLMYFIISVFSIFLAVACTSDNDVPFPDSEAPSIDFEGSALTRGIVNAADDMSAFDVWGWYSPISGTGTARQVFDATLVSRNGTTWTYDNIQRWQQGNSYQFYAIYPSFDAECGYKSASCDQDGTFTIYNFDCSKTGDEAVDLMTAVRSVKCGTDGYPGKVSMPFQHELAKVTITVISESSVVTITNCKIFGVRYKGTFIRKSIGTTSWQGFSVNAKEDDFFKAEEFSLNNDGENTLVRNVFDEMLLLPHTDDMLSEVKLLFSYHYGDEITDRESTINLKNEAVKSWEPGKSYDYTITIRSTDLSVAVKIMDWQETNTSVEWN